METETSSSCSVLIIAVGNLWSRLSTTNEMDVGSLHIPRSYITILVGMATMFISVALVLLIWRKISSLPLSPPVLTTQEPQMQTDTVKVQIGVEQPVVTTKNTAQIGVEQVVVTTENSAQNFNVSWPITNNSQLSLFHFTGAFDFQTAAMCCDRTCASRISQGVATAKR